MLSGFDGKPLKRETRRLVERAAPNVADSALATADYAALRVYAGAAKRVYITGYLVTTAPAGVAGMFVRDDSDTTTDDNGGTVIVDALSRRWKRQFDGAANFKWWGAVGGGAIDDTVAAQAAFDAAGLTNSEYFAVTDDYRRAKKALYIPDGTYLVGDLTVYQGTRIEWGPKAVFKLKPGATCAIKSVNYQGQSNPNFGVERVSLIRPRIDMDGNGTFGLLMQGLMNSLIDMPEILNVPAGTANYDDGSGLGATAYDKCGIALKGIDGVVGTYWNEIRMPRIKGAAGGGNNGIWLGTSSTGINQRANHNRIIAPYTEGLARGVQIMGGSDNYIELPEASLCDIGIAIGLTSGTVPCKRNHIKIPYLENCTTSGMRLSVNAYDTIIDGIGSTSGTATPLDDSGVNTAFLSANSDTYTSGFARFYKGGVRFPAAVDSTDRETNPNALDEYQEGTFTPVLEGMTTAGAGTYTTQIGEYTLIGNRCLFNLTLVWTAHTGTGNMRLTGLPFTSETGPRIYPCAVYGSNITMTAAHVLQASVQPNSKTIELTSYPSGGGAAVNIAMDVAGTIYISGHYLVNH